MNRDIPRQHWPLALLLAAGAVVFGIGLNWGLPSHAADPYLFGDHPRWSGRKIMSLAGGWNPASHLGADVDASPTKTDDGLTPVNFTDEQRAEIIRRYRLFSYQPDEWLTLRSLSQIKAHHGDPRVYQYGGLWIYPIGIALKIASYTGYVVLHSDPAFYIDHPSLFGRFYVIARAGSAFWGLAGIAAVWLLLYDLGVRPVLRFAGALCFILMPVIVNGAHEAKPHLGGAVLLLWTIWAALRYVRFGRRGWWWGSAILAGMAGAMVLSSFLGWIVLPVMMCLRPGGWKQRISGIIGLIIVAGLVYLALNPFVAINAIFAPDILRSNLGNSTAMYGLSNIASGAMNAVNLIGEGTSRLLAVMGLVGGCALMIRRPKLPGPDQSDLTAALWLIAAPALTVALVMALLGAGKPAEYGRFVMLTDCALLLGAFVAGDRFLKGKVERIAAPLILIATTAFFGLIYLRGFYRDASPEPSRLVQAAAIQKLWRQGYRTLATPRDPAPYNLPPVNLFDWHLYLLPRHQALRTDEMLPDVIVRPVDRPVQTPGTGILLYAQTPDPASHRPFASPISWADKPMEILHRRNRPATHGLARRFPALPSGAVASCLCVLVVEEGRKTGASCE